MATDQEIRDAGFKYIPQQKYLLNPFQIPTAPVPPVVDEGIVNTNAFTGGGDGFNPYNTNMSNVRQDYNAFPSRQAGEIYSKIFNPQPYGTGVESAQAAYNQANQALAQGMDPNSQGYGSFTGGTLTGLKDIANEIIMNNKEQYGAQGQYIDPYDSRYSSMTEAQKFMDNYPDYYGVPSGVPEPGIPGAIKRYMENSLLGKGFGMAKDFLGRVMPINERAIMENEARGAGIFTDDIGRIVTDDYNTAGGIMAGYNLNKIDEGTFGKRRGTIENTLGGKYGLTAGQIEAAKNDPNYKGPGADLIERLGLLDESEEDILGAKKKTTQIYKMRKDKKTSDKKRKEAEEAAAAAQSQAERNRVAQVQNRLDTGSYVDRDSGGYSASDRAVGGGREATNAQGQNAAQATAAGTGTSQGYSQHYARGGRAGYFYGGRVNFKNGGLASIL
jgi:hypothetical protein